MATRKRAASISNLKEGFLFKKSDILKWQRRFCVLNRDSFCYFKGEAKPSRKSSSGRIFLSDIVAVEVDPPGIKKPFVFGLRLQNDELIIFQAASKEDRESWQSSIDGAKEKEFLREKEDPLRRSMKKLTRDLRRATLAKDPDNGGIGCFLSSDFEGRIFVESVLEDGPLASGGVLREGDEILEVKDIPLKGKSIKDILHIISECPMDFPVTVRPVPAKKLSSSERPVSDSLVLLSERAHLESDSNQSPTDTPPVPPKSALSFQFIHESTSNLKSDRRNTTSDNSPLRRSSSHADPGSGMTEKTKSSNPQNTLTVDHVYEEPTPQESGRMREIVVGGHRGRPHIYEEVERLPQEEKQGSVPVPQVDEHTYEDPKQTKLSNKGHVIVIDGPRGRPHVYEDPDYRKSESEKQGCSKVPQAQEHTYEDPKQKQSDKAHVIIIDGPRGRPHVYEDPDYRKSEPEKQGCSKGSQADEHAYEDPKQKQSDKAHVILVDGPRGRPHVYEDPDYRHAEHKDRSTVEFPGGNEHLYECPNHPKSENKPVIVLEGPRGRPHVYEDPEHGKTAEHHTVVLQGPRGRPHVYEDPDHTHSLTNATGENQTSPSEARRNSPSGARQTSPKEARRTSPSGVHRIAPNGTKPPSPSAKHGTSPGRTNRASPNRTNQGSPSRIKQGLPQLE